MSRFFRTVILLAILVGCSSSTGTQKELTYTREITDKHSDGGGIKPAALRKQLLAEYEQVQRDRLGYHEAQFSSSAAILRVGFTPGSDQAYAVQRDGVAVMLDASGQLTELDRQVKRLDRVIDGGPSSNRIIGLSANGLLAAWNLSNLSQQLVIRPQQTTFDQVKLFDAEPLSHGRYVATASEGGLMEIWSLTSGHLIRSGRLKNIQPRQIAKNATSDYIPIGTNSGDVRVWSRGNSSTLLYQHSGPILNLEYLSHHNMIASVGKDGLFQLYSIPQRKVVFTHLFRKADYHLFVSQDERKIVAAPAVGRAIAVDLNTLKSSPLTAPVKISVSELDFAASNIHALSRHLASGLAMWNFGGGSPGRGQLHAEAPGLAYRYHIAADTNVAVILTDENYMEYWDISLNKYLGPALHSTNAEVTAFAINPDASTLIVTLSDGRILHQKVLFGGNRPIEVN